VVVMAVLPFSSLARLVTLFLRGGWTTVVAVGRVVRVFERARGGRFVVFVVGRGRSRRLGGVVSTAVTLRGLSSGERRGGRGRWIGLNVVVVVVLLSRLWMAVVLPFVAGRLARLFFFFVVSVPRPTRWGRVVVVLIVFVPSLLLFLLRRIFGWGSSPAMLIRALPVGVSPRAVPSLWLREEGCDDGLEGRRRRGGRSRWGWSGEKGRRRERWTARGGCERRGIWGRRAGGVVWRRWYDGLARVDGRRRNEGSKVLPP
jgi:hypothetical protein